MATRRRLLAHSPINCNRHYIQRRIKRLREHGAVENIGNGVYELTETAPARDRDVMKSFGKYAGTNIDEAVEEVHEKLGAGFTECDDVLSEQ